MLDNSPSAMATVQLINAANAKLIITPGPAMLSAAAEPSNSPVPIDPPTATIAIWPALSWWRSPSSRLIFPATGKRDRISESSYAPQGYCAVTFLTAGCRYGVAGQRQPLQHLMWVAPHVTPFYDV